ncbi:DUF2914 domain-containing protein, partial [candidate division KSB1 bacterium]|nr:DUF2914 domain-containing protein [candidate division KSB1 bacterium]
MRTPLFIFFFLFYCLAILQFIPGLPFAANQATSEISRSVFTTNVINNEPVDDLENITTDTRTVYYFTELRGMNGQTVTHRWLYGGEIVAEKVFAVQGNRDRIYSSKTLTSEWLGTWTVEVRDSGGNLLQQDFFVYQQPVARETESASNNTIQVKPVKTSPNPFIVKPITPAPTTTETFSESEETSEERTFVPKPLVPGRTPAIVKPEEPPVAVTEDTEAADAGEPVSPEPEEASEEQTLALQPLIPGRTPA